MRGLQADVAANAQRIRALDQSVKSIALKFAPGVDLPDAVQNQMNQRVAEFRDYFKLLGFRTRRRAPKVTTRGSAAGAIAYYNPTPNVIYVDPAYAESEYPILRQYAHVVLYAVHPFDNKQPLTNYEWVALEYGLADYFPASFLGNSTLEARGSGAKANQDLIVELNNEERLTGVGENLQLHQTYARQRAWGGLLWAIREALGQQKADQYIYAAWQASSGEDENSIGRGFMANLLRQAARSDPAAEAQMRRVLLNRGLTSDELPEAVTEPAA